MKKLIVLFLMISLSALTGCATMFGSSSNKSVKLTTNVEQAKVYVDGRYYDTTETGTMLIRLDGNTAHDITVKKKGYASVTRPVTRDVQGVYFLNIPLLVVFVVPGVLGFIIDGSSGNMYAYEAVNVNLDK